MKSNNKQSGTPAGHHNQPAGPANMKGYMTKTITINKAVERMITAVNIVTGDDGHRSQEAVKTFLELLKMEDKDYNKQQKYYG